jgi:D-sedoheptulose 7-phosphate isomerase
MSDPFAPSIADHRRLVEWLETQVPLLQQIGQMIADAIDAGQCVYLLGNGGSAADAQHIAAELVGQFRRPRRALPAVALTTDTSCLLSISNDYGFGHVFARQVEALVRSGDVVWALSTSGNSPNVIEAVQVARGLGARTIGFTGRSGGKLKPLCDLCLCADHTSSDRIQETHQLAYHMICDYVEQHFTQPLT